MKRIVVTGVSGTLGSALARFYTQQGCEVIGITRQPDAKHEWCARVVANAQTSEADAAALVALDADALILCAGAIETELGAAGLPLASATRAIYEINAVFPSFVALAAASPERAGPRPLDVVAIGSIADGMPSAFGPVYHASKVALHYFFQGVAPIARQANPRVRLRLYRPGVIRGPLSWAPLLRLNERGRRLRARRCERAPEADVVAARIARWIDGDQWIGSYDEPLSFRALKLLFALAPGLYARLQHAGWRAGSRVS
jgi:NAD(P)-dependent dehydrogenase (short-subunit alcohol dehydrogenase family)